MAEKKKQILTIEFNDGSSETIYDSDSGEIEKAIKDFQDRRSTISVGTISGGLEKTVISTSEIRALVPKWIETSEDDTLGHTRLDRNMIETKNRLGKGTRLGI